MSSLSANKHSQHIPPALDIDYTDAATICGYQQLLCRQLQQANAFTYPPTETSLTRHLRSQGAIWLTKVKPLIDNTLSGNNVLNDIPNLISSYDIMHRVSRRTTCYDYLRNTRLKATDLWLKGNKTLSGTDIALMLLSEIDTDILTLPQRYTNYGLSTLSCWIAQLTNHGRFTDIPLPEAYSRLRYLTTCDLFAYIKTGCQTQVKAQWLKAHKPSDPSALDTPTLTLYIDLVQTATQAGVTPPHPLEDILPNYLSRSDLNPLTRQALTQ